jgi:hypothetical protein
MGSVLRSGTQPFHDAPARALMRGMGDHDDEKGQAQEKL